MLKAVLRKGAIVPLEPLPPEWGEGTALKIAKLNTEQLDIDAWAKSMNQLCADSSTEDEGVMQNALDEQRRQGKAQTRRDMGLSEFVLVPITDPVKQAALDRLRKGRSTKEDRKLLGQPAKRRK
jgi:hypothetical protein